MPAKINTAALELLTRAATNFICEPKPSSWTDEDWELLNTSIWMAQQTLEKEDTNFLRRTTTMTTSKNDWVVTTYNEFEKRTGRFTIENRTEREAAKEAEASVVVRHAHDWTLTPKKRKLTVNEREKELLRMAVIYAIPNLDDVIEAFSDEFGLEASSAPYCIARISVDGCSMQPPTEEEMSELLKHF